MAKTVRHEAEQFEFPFAVDDRPAPFEHLEPEAGLLLAKRVARGAHCQWWVRRSGIYKRMIGGQWLKIG